MKYTILISLTFFLFTSLPAQIPDTLEVYTPQIEVHSESTVTIPVKVNGYKQIESMQFSINWNIHQFRFDSIKSINPASDIEVTDIGLARTDEGIVVLSFIDPFTGGISLPDSSTLFKMAFTVIGPPSQKNPINISGYDRAIDAFGQGKFRTVIPGKSINSITAPSSLQLYTTACSVTKPTMPNGKITIQAYGGQAPMNLFFKPVDEQSPDITVIGNGAVVAYDSLAADTYDILIRDADGIEVRDTISLQSRMQWNVDLTIAEPTCAYSDDGSAEINSINGMQPPYVIRWSTFDLLIPELDSIDNGGYYVRITDSLGCVYEEVFSLNTPEPETQITLTDVSCAGSEDGSVSVEVIDGNPFPDTTYLFSLDGDTAMRSTSFSADMLAAGQHTITVIDSSDCAYNYDFTIGYQNEIAIIDTTILNIGCDGSPGGFMGEIVDTGSSPDQLNFTLNPDIGDRTRTDSTIAIENLPEGSYSLTIAVDGDSANCNKTINFRITAPPPLRITIDSISHEVCAGDSNAFLKVSATGGLGSLYDYKWADGDTNRIRENLSPAEYCITVTDESGCSTDSCFTINAGSKFNYVLDTIRALSCPNAGDGYAQFHLEHLSGPVSDAYTIEITPQTDYEISKDTIVRIDSLQSGTYSISVINENGCQIDTTISVGEPPAPLIVLDSIVDAGCFNAAEGYIGLAAESPIDSLTSVKWAWETGDTTSYIANIKAGYYTVTVTDRNNCSYTSTYSIDSIGGPVVDSIRIKEPSCYNAEDGLISIISVESKAGITSIEWSAGDTTATIDSLVSGNYSFSIADSAGCILQNEIFLPQPDSLKLEITTRAQTADSPGRASLSINGGMAPYEITWPQGASPVKGDSVVELSAGNYNVVVIDNHGCIETTSFSIANRTSLINPPEENVTLFPNPVQNVLWVDGIPSKYLRKLEVKFTGLTGRTYYPHTSIEGKLLRVNTSALYPAIYTLIIKFKGNYIYEKVVIQP